MAVQEKGEQRLPGHEVEEVLVCAEEDVLLLVQQPAGGSVTRSKRRYRLELVRLGHVLVTAAVFVSPDRPAQDS